MSKALDGQRLDHITPDGKKVGGVRVNGDFFETMTEFVDTTTGRAFLLYVVVEESHVMLWYRGDGLERMALGVFQANVRNKVFRIKQRGIGYDASFPVVGIHPMFCGLRKRAKH